jgi:2,4-dienoyl-CoA reductase-like NADH-dependent reductase (Old Yellow Enzyme family)
MYTGAAKNASRIGFNGTDVHSTNG